MSAPVQPVVRWLAFNVNHNVRVKLTDRGREIHRENFDRFLQLCPAFPYPYRKPEEDAEGWSKWQMWDLMKEFGSHMNMGTPLPFETSIELDVEST